MKPTTIATLPFFLLVGGAPLWASTAVIDLNAPGAIDALARDNPDHYAKIEKILADVSRRPPESVPRWMKSEFGAEQVNYPSLLKTSDPAQRSLSFTLERTRYEVTLRVPTRWSFAAQ
jgi:hypothetical protein